MVRTRRSPFMHTRSALEHRLGESDGNVAVVSQQAANGTEGVAGQIAVADD